VTQAETRGDPEGSFADKRTMLAAVRSIREQNPMLGLRGCRLGLLFPEIIEMQVRAIMEAAVQLTKEGVDVHPEIMIPLVGAIEELRRTKGYLQKTVDAVLAEAGIKVPYKFGTMIELPRAALIAGEIATEAEFFSFGTNDLTQTTFGFSRDDAEGKIIIPYVEQKILPSNPFETLDRGGVGRLMNIAVIEGRQTRPTSPWASAVSMAVTRHRSPSARSSTSTTSRARPTGCPWHGSPPPTPGWRRGMRIAEAARHSS